MTTLAQDDPGDAGLAPAGRRPRGAFWRLAPGEEWRRNLYVVMFAVFVSFTGFTFVMPFLPLYIKQLGVGDAGDAALWSGFLFGVSPLISGLMAPVWAVLLAVTLASSYWLIGRG